MTEGTVLLRKSARVFICLIIIGALSLVVTSRSEGNGLCTEENATLKCLKQHAKELYANNNSLFWDILNRAALRAEKCAPISETAAFMELVRIERDGAFEEFFHKKIEALCISKTDCFFEATAHLSTEDQVTIIDILANPLFFEQTQIAEAVDKKKDDNNFKGLVDIYFEKTLETRREMQYIAYVSWLRK
jgi:hypothetical protein